jgi:hypothetical protein
MYFIDLVGCALAPVVFWMAMSTAGVLLVTLLSVAAYGIVAVVLYRRVA